MGRAIKSNAANEASHLATIKNRASALELRRAGASLREIANAIGVSHVQAKRYLDAAMKDLQDAQNDSAEATRAVELDRLDRLHMALWPRAIGGKDKAPDYHAIDRLVRIADRRAKLLGLDAPVRTELTGRDGAPLLSFEDLKRRVVGDDNE